MVIVSCFKRRFTWPYVCSSFLVSVDKSFNNENYKKETTLSTYIWDLKENDQQYNLKWEIIAKCSPYKCGTNRCSVCSTEKLLIMKYKNLPSINLLNVRSEILNKCRHKSKFKLINIK